MHVHPITEDVHVGRQASNRIAQAISPPISPAETERKDQISAWDRYGLNVWGYGGYGVQGLGCRAWGLGGWEWEIKFNLDALLGLVGPERKALLHRAAGLFGDLRSKLLGDA